MKIRFCKAFTQKETTRCVKRSEFSSDFLKNGRGDRIRTCDLYVPNVALYQAKLRPDIFSTTDSAVERLKEP